MNHSQTNTRFLVGLTGGIASGKSAVSDHLESLGVALVDADLVAREVVKPKSAALNKLQTLFGSSIITSTGELDRARLRSIIFDSENQRKKLEAVLHPAIKNRSTELIEKHMMDGAAYVVYAVPLLVETNQMERFDRIVVVDVSRETQIRRICLRDKTTELQAEKILSSQASRSQRLSVADDVINNEGTLAELKSQVEELHTLYLKLAAQTDSDA